MNPEFTTAVCIVLVTYFIAVVACIILIPRLLNRLCREVKPNMWRSYLTLFPKQEEIEQLQLHTQL